MLQLPSINWIDILIVVILLYEAYRGWQSGFVYLATSFFSFILSIWLSVVSNPMASSFLTGKFGVSSSWSSPAAYIVVAIITFAIINELLVLGVSQLPSNVLHSKYSSWLGTVISAVNGCVIAAFFLLVILALPIRGTVKRDIQNSFLGQRLVAVSRQYGGPVPSVITNFGEKATKFITVDPKSSESLTIDVAPKATDLFTDSIAEWHMVGLVNRERVKAGVPILTLDAKISDVARLHSRDMFLRRYFSHITPDGKDPGARLSTDGVAYMIAGENLAYAPDVEIAHKGLMNSPEHKKNILDPEYHRIGIGIITTDSYGMMVTQNFTN